MLRLGGVRKLSVGVLLLAGSWWVAAPALSTGPYRPKPVDFEQRLAGKVRAVGKPARTAAAGPQRLRAAEDHRHADGHHRRPVRFKTRRVRAPKRFDLVGVAGELRALELRTKRAGERWSDWVETANGDPVWAGGANRVQVRSRGPRISGRLHYVNVTGTSTTPSRALTAVRSAISAAVGAAFGTERASAAKALEYVPRAEWGAGEGGCTPRSDPYFGDRPRIGVVHHTVTSNDYPPGTAPAVVLGICRYHRNANGWNDIGYNALVDRYGVLYEGRAGGLAGAVVGAHAQGWNSVSTGVALIGTHTSEEPPRRARAKLARWLAWKLASHGRRKARGSVTIRSAGGSQNRYPAGAKARVHRISTHREVGRTSCAGEATETKIKGIRRRIQRTLDKWGDAPPNLIPTSGPEPGEAIVGDPYYPPEPER